MVVSPVALVVALIAKKPVAVSFSCRCRSSFTNDSIDRLWVRSVAMYLMRLRTFVECCGFSGRKTFASHALRIEMLCKRVPTCAGRGFGQSEHFLVANSMMRRCANSTCSSSTGALLQAFMRRDARQMAIYAPSCGCWRNDKNESVNMSLRVASASRQSSTLKTAR